MKEHDLRYIKTDELIRKAFLTCCAEHTVEEIHINEICAEARISRNAFYGHYENKYELLEAIYADVSRQMLAELSSETISSLAKDAMYGVSAWCVHCISQNREVMAVLARSSENRFREMMREVFIDGTLNAVFDGTEKIEENTMLKMSKSYIADGLTSITLLWLADPEPADEEKLINFLYDISHPSAAFFYRLLDSTPGISRKTDI